MTVAAADDIAGRYDDTQPELPPEGLASLPPLAIHVGSMLSNIRDLGSDVRAG